MTFSTALEQPADDTISGDGISLREALRNLIENAVRHGPTHNQIEVSLSRTVDEVLLCVNDAGPGIAQEQRQAVLDRFYSLDKQTSGSGLGLSIVESVANSHGGKLELSHSTLGGLCACLRFPATLCLIFALLFLSPSSSHAQDSLTVWSATDSSAMQPVIDGFEQANPHIKVNYREYQSVDLYQDVRRDPHAVDIVISSAMDLQFDLVNRGLAQRVALKTTVPDWASWRSELYGFTFEPAVLIYARSAFTAQELPRTHRELATFLREKKDRLSGRVGTYDVQLSGVGYLYATQDAAQGQEALRITEALGRIDGKSYCCTSQMLQEVASGRLDLAYNVIGSYALAAAKKDPRIGVALFDDYNLVMSRTVFVSRYAANLDAARSFVAYLASNAGQEAISSNSALISLNGGIEQLRKALGAPYSQQELSLLPIRLSAGLITYLDKLKRARFLENWQGSLAAEP